MTMNAPGSGNHPVAGTRQFGYEQNSDGSYNFFVRGVDRFDNNIIENGAYMASFLDNDPANPFFKSDELWESFQNNFNQFVNVRGGVSTVILADTDNKPDWDKVQDVLRGDSPISDLDCN